MTASPNKHSGPTIADIYGSSTLPALHNASVKTKHRRGTGVGKAAGGNPLRGVPAAVTRAKLRTQPTAATPLVAAPPRTRAARHTAQHRMPYDTINVLATPQSIGCVCWSIANRQMSTVFFSSQEIRPGTNQMPGRCTWSLQSFKEW
ncbi:hypothetical protein GCM10009789_12560 [Kribbella sancticallisti]|uniref:Uncharacterized protein n=1 Tax=Kribbella sancticallisti TaxID=460087 RepID=A0ABN2CLX5_9ACTN